MWDFWEAYERKYPGSDLRNIEDIKHITKAVGRLTPGRLDKELKRATVKTQRKTNLTIPPEVHDSVAPEIYKAKYKDLVCIVSWKDGEPEIKISFKREFTKGIQDTPKNGGYSLGQVMKFAAHRNSKTLVGYYLDNISNVDGTAVFLGLEPRRDLIEDFRSASMKRNPDL
ncbi:hypothetical protein BKA61DRAFT_688306 [Leptodontidium sp. MPI-SDFR-AT-0119]|nr:hypothetical protein BKA61DRAFT_688306 [Leptodontidium sp. MPI-SDFR-AT-0119]